MKTSKLLSMCILFVVGGIITASAIYTTPLRYTHFIEPTINDVDPSTFYEQFSENSDSFIFIDVRPPSAYNKEHARGSINIPLHLLYGEKDILPRKDKEIVLICTGGAASGVGYSYLEHYGFSNIQRIEDGINAWKEAGLPTEN